MAVEKYIDVLRAEGNKHRIVLARVSVLSTEDGGKAGPFGEKYRPNHNFGDAVNRDFYIGQIEVPAGVWVYPGQSKEFQITFLSGPGLSQHLFIGNRWRIQEGAKLVAIGEVLKVDNL
jgi:translation elongation factor EF-Tu-like GTPase